MLSIYEAIIALSVFLLRILMYFLLFCLYSSTKWKIITLINDEICVCLFFNTTFYLNQLPLYSFVYLDMYFFVDLLVKFRYCGKATKFEKKTSTFFKLFVLLRISELVSNGQCFFCHCIAVVLSLIYRNI